jgi:hypothetical protein
VEGESFLNGVTGHQEPLGHGFVDEASGTIAEHLRKHRSSRSIPWWAIIPSPSTPHPNRQFRIDNRLEKQQQQR